MVTLQDVPVPEHPPPDHPVKVEPAEAAAVRTTVEPREKVFEQLTPQSMPPGADVTVPIPAPSFVTVNEGVGFGMNVAVTDLAASIGTLHAYRPEQAPDQPAKIESAAGVTLRTTSEPKVKLAEHVVPQLIPAGCEVTVPEPVRPSRS
jgi:hypothetical protein